MKLLSIGLIRKPEARTLIRESSKEPSRLYVFYPDTQTTALPIEFPGRNEHRHRVVAYRCQTVVDALASVASEDDRLPLA